MAMPWVYKHAQLAGGDSDAMTGEELWGALAEARNNLEQSYVLILGLASNGPVSCDVVTQYNAAVQSQLDLEQAAIDEMIRDGIAIGISSPAGLPRLPECSGSESTIELVPATASEGLSGAARRYRDMQHRYALAVAKYGSSGGAGLNGVFVPILIVAGIIVVAGAAAWVLPKIFYSASRAAVERQQSLTEAVKEAIKAGMSAKDVTAMLKAMGIAMEQGNPDQGLPTWLWCTFGVIGGVVLYAGLGYAHKRGWLKPLETRIKRYAFEH